jgi:predicted nucleotidyltransferase
LKNACSEEPIVLAVFLFGSYADGYATEHSDVDLGLLLMGSPGLQERLALEVRLCQALEREDVDFLLLRDAPISLRFRAISGRILYEREPDSVSDFMQRTMVEYYDFQHVLKTYEREFAKSLEHDYGL